MLRTLPVAYDEDEADGDTTNLSTLALTDGAANDDEVEIAAVPPQALPLSLASSGESSADAARSDDRTTTIDLSAPVHHDEPRGSIPPWWRRLGARLGALFRLRREQPALPPLPPPSRSGTVVSQASRVGGLLVEEMFHWLWRLDAQPLASIEALAAHVRAARAAGPSAFLEAHVRFVVSRELPGRDGTIRVSRLRDKLIGHPRHDVDRVLAHLAAEGLFDLMAAEPASGGRPRDPGLHDPAGDKFDCLRVRQA